jgi:hypothetical protein
VVPALLLLLLRLDPLPAPVDPLLVPPSVAGPPPLTADDVPPDELGPVSPLELPEESPGVGVVADVPHASAHTADSEIVRIRGWR